MDTRAQLKRWRRRLQQQREAELRACRAKWRSRIHSVDRLLRTPATADGVKSHTRPGRARPIAVSAYTLEGNMKRGRNKAVLKLVRHILQHNRGFFTAATLADLINRTRSFSITRRDLSQPLGSLRQLGEIRLVARSGGRKAHVYVKL